MVESYDEVQKFTVTELCSWLEGKEDITEDIITAIETNRVNGKTFVDLSDDDLKELFSLFGDRKAVQRIVASLKPQPQPHHAVLSALQPVGGCENSLSHFKIPDRFSRATMERLDKGEITDGLRCEIVSAVCVPWYQMCEYPSREEYTAVSQQLVQKYPVLKDSTGNGYGSWKQQIRRKFKNLRAPPSVKQKRTRDEDKENNVEPPPNQPSKKRKLFKNSDIEVTEEEEEKYEHDIKSLQEECAKDKPSKTRVKTFMKDTLAIRRNWIDKEGPTVDEILENFPPLKMSSSYLQKELAAVVKSDLPEDDEIKSTWRKFLEKINRKVEIEASKSNLQKLRDQHEEEKLLYPDETALRQLEQVYGLKYLCSLLAPKAKCTLIHHFDNPSDVEKEAEKVKLNHPYVGVVANDDSLSFFVVTERLVVLTTSSFFKAMGGMMACYYVFDIQYPQPLNIPLTFIQHFVYSIKEDVIPQALVRFISCLDKL